MKRLLWVWLLGIAACKDQGPDPFAGARKALAEGSARRAMAAVGNETAGDGLVIRLRASVMLRQWGEVERLLGTVPEGPDKVALACLFSAERRDVTAVRLCETARTVSVADPVLADEVVVAAARAYELDRRNGEAEATLKALVVARPTTPNRRALVELYEKQGLVPEAIAVLDGWLAADASDATVKPRLAQLLERKVKGDLLDKRFVDAEAAARRVLELAPTRHVIRYHLADALAGQGKTAEAETERKRAKDAGVDPPPPVDTLPGMDPNAKPPKGSSGETGHDGHDHP